MGLRAAALVAALAGLAGCGSAAAEDPPEIRSAGYSEPTTRYPHGALGDDEEWTVLNLALNTCRVCAGMVQRFEQIRLPENRVFEDTEPRLVDVDGDGLSEVVVVESDADLGARLAVYDETGLVAATDFIGQRNRWLAPLGAADLDGDGRVEIAYVDRPHLARILRVVEFGADGVLRDEAAAPGHTNHRFGDPAIEGGIFDCGAGPEIVTASADWTRVLASRLEGRALLTRDLGPYGGPGSLHC